ncbi:MAG TPA: isoprenylcysteine carboxylmethyltransferase family protein [Steroidobacteraceae bacterium]|nr:isoprenylcysteine carboxylmethyltransferase family protein [Steroidobacteraceae bacterium]
MQEPALIVGCLWAAFILCWLVLARFNKKASRRPWRAALALRLMVLAVLLVLMVLRRHGMAGLLTSLGHTQTFHVGTAGQWLGVGLCLAGFAFAFWARIHIGRNWGMPMSLRQGHELVTSGPYAHVRHPIYSGLMLAMIGSALAVGVLWLLFLAFYFTYFIVSARSEEKMMLAQFPDSYSAYRRRTKMLIPFVF